MTITRLVSRAALVFLLAHCAVPAFAASATIPLEIESPDFPDILALAAFDLGAPAEEIQRITLHLVGSHQDILFVDIARPYVVDTHAAVLDIRLGEDGASIWAFQTLHTFPAGEGEFEVEIVLFDRSVDEREPLSTGWIGIECGPRILQPGDGTQLSASSSWGVIDVAAFVVESSGAVANLEESWGSIKARY